MTIRESTPIPNLQSYVDPMLIARASRNGQTRLSWLWNLAHYLDGMGVGFVYLDDLFILAKQADRDLSQSQFDKFIRAGKKDEYWTLTRQAYRGEKEYRRRLFYTSYQKLALKGAGQDNTNIPGAKSVLINLHWKKYLPLAYAAWFKVNIDAKQNTKTLIDGTKKQSRKNNLLLISRQRITEIWGISAPTQRKWEQIAHIEVKPTLVQAEEGAQRGIDIPDHATPFLTKNNSRQWRWQTVNNYKPSSMKISDSKRTRKTLRRKYRALVNNADSDDQPLSTQGQEQGNSLPCSEGSLRSFEQRYFDYKHAKDGFKAAKSYKKHCQSARDDTPSYVTIGRDRFGRLKLEKVVTTYQQQTTVDSWDRERMYALEWLEYCRLERAYGL